MQDKERIKELLGSGLSNEVVATAVGCDSSYISQLLSDELFANEVSALRMNSLTEHNTRDKRLNGLEDSVIEKLEEAIHWLTKPMDMLRALNVINAAKRRGVPAHEALVINNNIVNLTLPPVILNKFVTTPLGEVIEVEGQTLVTMPAHNLLKRLQESRNDKKDVYEQVANHIPARG